MAEAGQETRDGNAIQVANMSGKKIQFSKSTALLPPRAFIKGSLSGAGTRNLIQALQYEIDLS